MSTDTNFFIGWYIKGKYRYTKSNEREYICPRNQKHEIDGAIANYCSICGSKITTRARLTPIVLDIYDIPEEVGCLEDAFIEPEYMSKENEVILISNYSLCGSYLQAFESNEIVDLSQDKQEKQYTEFMNRHGEDIKLLKEYVYDNVQLFYGAFVYYS